MKMNNRVQDPFKASLTKEQRRKYFILRHWRKILFFASFLLSFLNPNRILISAFTFVILFNIACLIGKWVYKFDLSNMTKFKATVAVTSPPMAQTVAEDPLASVTQGAPADDTDLTKALEALSKLYNKQITEKDLNDDNKGE